jgi:hypothetical protein
MNIPDRIAKLPTDKRGIPVPWFVAYPNGEPDFRVIESGRIQEAYRDQKCWICGEKLGRFLAYTIGPMCAITRTSSEAASHRECSLYAVRVCPFLTRPHMKRNEREKPEGCQEPAGIHLDRNPGVVAVWITFDFAVMRVDRGILFPIGEPLEVLLYCEGRQATRAEILESIAGGLPSLRELAEKDGPEAVAELEQQHQAALKLLPVV